MKAPATTRSGRDWMTWAGARLSALMLATVAGWAAAMAVTLPMQLVKIQANATGTFGELLRSCAAGAAIWCLWSFAFTALAGLLGGLPLVLLVRETWLLRHPRLSAAAAAFLGWTVVLIKFEVWEMILPEHTILDRIFALYSLLFSVSCGVAAAVYLRIVGRIRKQDTTA
jgi:hypothetical protein